MDLWGRKIPTLPPNVSEINHQLELLRSAIREFNKLNDNNEYDVDLFLRAKAARNWFIDRNLPIPIDPKADEFEDLPGLVPSTPYATPREPATQTPSTRSAPSALKEPQEAAPTHNGLLREYFSVEEMNEHGLRRAKKTTWILTPEGRRTEIYQMEDIAYAEWPLQGNESCGIFIILDGHGGKECALATLKLLKQYLTPVLLETRGPTGVDISSFFVNIDKEMENMKVLDRKNKTEIYKFDSEGCTGTVALLWKDEDGKRWLQLANVGDSLAFLNRDGKAIALCEEHKVANPNERERLKAQNVPVRPDSVRLPKLGLAVSRMFGDHFAKEVYPGGPTAAPHVFGPTQLTPQDSYLILASDGVWDVMSGQDVVDFIKAKGAEGKQDAKHLAEALMQHTLGFKVDDNVSIIIVRL